MFLGQVLKFSHEICNIERLIRQKLCVTFKLEVVRILEFIQFDVIKREVLINTTFKYAFLNLIIVVKSCEELI